MALRTSNRLAHHAAWINGVPAHVKTRWQESLLSIRSEHCIAAQLFMLGQPKHLFGGKISPAMRAR
jgi:hypothetical protein